MGRRPTLVVVAGSCALLESSASGGIAHRSKRWTVAGSIAELHAFRPGWSTLEVDVLEPVKGEAKRHDDPEQQDDEREPVLKEEGDAPLEHLFL